MKYFALCLFVLLSFTSFSQITGEGLVINEFMASNDSTATDPAGDYDDWIEIFNNSEDTIDLSGFFVSDKEDNITKFEIPDSLNVTIEPQGYVIIWADEDGDKAQEGIHANFKLSGGGEAVILSNQDSVILDQIVYGEQTTDLSFARQPNGTGDFKIGLPTFGVSNNGITSSNDNLIVDLNTIKIFPNPTSGLFEVIINHSTTTNNLIRVYNSLGSLIMNEINLGKRSKIDLSEYRSGAYFIVINDKYTRKVLLSK